MKNQWTARFGSALAIVSIAFGPRTNASAQNGQLNVKVDQPGVKISPMLYGLMTEEINHAYDGGIYAELIQNRAFKDNSEKPVHWTMVQEGGGSGSMRLDGTQPLNAVQSTSLKLEVTSAGANGRVGVANDGYWGIPVKPNTRYHASFYARASEGFRGPITASLESAEGASTVARASISHITSEWKKYSVTLTTGKVAASVRNRFVLSAASPGSVWLSLVSLFPPTYHNRRNGNRIDLMEKLGDMKPAFLRLPGGNYLEGNTIAERFEWKDTIHSVERRPGHQGPWGYRSTDGMGLLEFLEWCEDLHMRPVLAVFAGYALGGEHIPAGSGLTPFVQEALEEIEYATGKRSTKWGARRAADGHPRPFSIDYVEVGNEDGFDRSGSYDGRFTQFYDAIKAKYPRLQIIATAPVTTRTPDVLDDHYYRTAADMERDAHHYDRVSRKGPKIFVGEWASTEGNPTPTLQAALGDAAWLTGMERNSDLVVISSYAPLLVNVNRGAAQWGTNLIGYDALTSFGSPSYYVQKMFNNSRGDIVVPVEIVPQQPAVAAALRPQGGIGVGTWLTQSEYKDIKVTRGDHALYQSDFSAGDAGWNKSSGEWKVENGALVQTGGAENSRAMAGDPAWTDYTLTLKARKISGREGFLILFHAQDENNYLWWNIGGWGNTRSALERAYQGSKHELGEATGTTVETGRWYDVRVEVKGTAIRCFLDDRLITETTDVPGALPPPLYATASRVEANGDLILKVVNVSNAPQTLDVHLQGVREVDAAAAGEVISGDPGDVNSLASPTRVAPQSLHITNAAPDFPHAFPPHSVSVIRLKVR